MRHVVIRRRATLENAGLIPRIPVDIHPVLGNAPAMFDGLGLRTSAASTSPTSRRKVHGRIRQAAEGGGIPQGLLRQRICSSVASGISTAKKLLEGRSIDDEELQLNLDGGNWRSSRRSGLHLQTIVDAFELD